MQNQVQMPGEQALHIGHARNPGGQLRENYGQKSRDQSLGEKSGTKAY